MIRISVFVLGCLVLATPARADLKLCNRMSYIVDAAVALERRATIATRGWFRIEPGLCRSVLDGSTDDDHVYVHARTPAVYGASPMAKTGHADLCVEDRNFTITDARSCRSDRMASFTAVKPTEGENGPTVTLAEEAEYTAEQARLAGIQRLLIIAGYDASPIDGLAGRKTDAAIAAFVESRKLPAGAAGAPDFVTTLFDLAQSPEGNGFSWCNETSYPVMASLGTHEDGTIVTRGWYRIEPGKCLRPDVPGDSRKLYTYAEAVDAQGALVKRGNQPLAWGGDTLMCTRDGKFEVSDQKDCSARGLQDAPFASIDTGGRASTVIRFKEP